MKSEYFFLFGVLSRGQPCESDVETGEILRKKERDIVLKCCNNEVRSGELWILKDIKGFTARKLYTAKCNICGDDIALLVEKRINDGKIFTNNFNGIEAVKVLYREKKRKIVCLPKIEYNNLYGWIYGVNTEIRNKKGETTQIRQYSSDFYGNKKLAKQILN